MSNEAERTSQRIYLKDCSFESPLSPGLFKRDLKWKPDLKVDLNNTGKKFDGDNVDVVLTLSVTAEQEGETAYLVEVQYAGLFTIKGLTEDQIVYAVNVVAPTALFPYARETADSLVRKGGFPSLDLQPINFEAAYQQKMAQQSTPTESH